MKNNKLIIVLIALVLLIGGGYLILNDRSQNNNGDANVPKPGNADVENVDILILESFPLQISALVAGSVSDSCSGAKEREINFIDDTFYIVLDEERDSEAVCAQVITPFEKTVPIDVYNFEAGEYFVDVNGVKESFTLEQDNSL